MSADKPTPEEQAQGDRAMASLETMAVTWCAKHGMNKAVADVLSAVNSRMPGAIERAQRILMGLLHSAHMEGLYEGRTSLTTSPPRRREHESSVECWCCPELVHKDPETGAKVWVHRHVQ